MGARADSQTRRVPSVKPQHKGTSPPRSFATRKSHVNEEIESTSRPLHSLKASSHRTKRRQHADRARRTSAARPRLPAGRTRPAETLLAEYDPRSGRRLAARGVSLKTTVNVPRKQYGASLRVGPGVEPGYFPTHAILVRCEIAVSRDPPHSSQIEAARPGQQSNSRRRCPSTSLFR